MSILCKTTTDLSLVVLDENFTPLKLRPFNRYEKSVKKCFLRPFPNCEKPTSRCSLKPAFMCEKFMKRFRTMSSLGEIINKNSSGLSFYIFLTDYFYLSHKPFHSFQLSLNPIPILQNLRPNHREIVRGYILLSRQEK